MPLGPKVSTLIKTEIAEKYIQMRSKDSKVTAKEVQAVIQSKLRKNDPKLSNDWPGLSAVQKVITEIHKREKGLLPDPLDASWSFGCLTEHEIPPEAMRAVIRVWNWHVSCDEPFSIREAKWVSRLYTILDPIEDQQTLMDWASALALRERACQDMREPFTTPDLDILLTKPDYSKLIKDAKLNRLKEFQPKPTIRDILEKAKRNPSRWPAGVKPEFTDLDIIKRKKGGTKQNER